MEERVRLMESLPALARMDMSELAVRLVSWIMVLFPLKKFVNYNNDPLNFSSILVVNVIPHLL